MAFNTPAQCNASVKPLSDNSLSTHSFQPKVVLDPNSKRMGISIIQRVYEKSTLTIGIVPCLLLIGMVRFGMGGLFAYILRGRIVGGDLFSLMARRTLAFRLCHDGVIDQGRWVIVFEREDTVKEEKGRKCLEYEGNLS